MKTDAAVLVDLIERLKEVGTAKDKAAYQALSAFDRANGDGFSTFAIVRDCCSRLRDAIDQIPDITDVHKRSFLSALQAFENNFTLGNMGSAWGTFLQNISSNLHVQALHFLDFILQSQEFWKSRQIDIDDASKLFDSLEDFIQQSDVPEYLKNILKNDVTKLRFILANHEKFGEQDYWAKFQKLTGLFGAVYMTLDEGAREQGKPLIQRMFRKVIFGMSVSADTAQLITTFAQMLPRA